MQGVVRQVHRQFVSDGCEDVVVGGVGGVEVLLGEGDEDGSLMITVGIFFDIGHFLVFVLHGTTSFLRVLFLSEAIFFVDLFELFWQF